MSRRYMNESYIHGWIIVGYTLILAELDAILKGINLALQWDATKLHIFTDFTYGADMLTR